MRRSWLLMQVSPALISTITDEVLAEVGQWQMRPLEVMYPIVYFDALRLNIRDEGAVRNKAVYLALGIRASGQTGRRAQGSAGIVDRADRRRLDCCTQAD